MLRSVAVGLAVFTGLTAGGTPADAATTAREKVATKSEVVKAHRAPRTKQVHSRLGRGDSRTAINVKFAEGSDVRLRRGHLVRVTTGQRIEEVERLLDRYPGVQITRLFSSSSESQIDANHEKAVDHSGIAPADLNLFFRFEIRANQIATDFIDQMNALDIVDSAGAEPLPAPAPATANYRTLQGYHGPASSSGVDADYARGFAGGRGEHVRIADIEFSWNRNHEDLSKLRVAGSAIANGTPCDFSNDTNHGTGVMGEMVGDDNGFGVTGLSPGAVALTVNALRLNSAGTCVGAIADAVNVAANNLAAGDVMLIEQHIAGPRYPGDGSQTGFVPVEWEQSGATWSAIRNATARGVIVIEPAGNGYQNLDDPIYNASNGQNWFSWDSGAIMVGAGNAQGCVYGNNPTIARGRLSYSNYGARVNVQGWGGCVVTTGYGDLSAGSGINQWYSKQFSGTSSASPIVASSAAILSSIAEARGYQVSPAWMRSTLMATGQPQQFGNAGHIGPLPNLRSAIAQIPGGTTTTAPVIADAGRNVAGGALSGGVPVTQRWSVTSGTAARYEVWLSTDGGAWAKTTLSNPAVSSATFRLTANHNYRFAARAANAAGTWGAWAYSPTINLGQYQENYASGNPAYAGSWTRPAYSPASGGALAVSSKAGSVANFNFTGTSVAWVATKANNRGSAHVYLDGVYSKTVSLYSATTIPKAIAFTASWRTAGPHRITIRVVGTTGRPKVDVDAFVRLR